MFWFGHRRRLRDLEDRVRQLEKQNSILSLALQNIQSALTAAAQNQTSVAKDVRDIQNIVSVFLQQAEAADVRYGFDPGDGYDH